MSVWCMYRFFVKVTGEHIYAFASHTCNQCGRKQSLSLKQKCFLETNTNQPNWDWTLGSNWHTTKIRQKISVRNGKRETKTNGTESATKQKLQKKKQMKLNKKTIVEWRCQREYKHHNSNGKLPLTKQKNHSHWIFSVIWYDTHR